jgi:hypothetical protein
MVAMARGLNSRVLLCLVLGCAALPAAARQPAMMDANGAGAGCPVTAEADTDLEPVRTDKRAVAPTRARAPATRRGGDTDAATRAPRWHSFLPGMIR